MEQSTSEKILDVAQSLVVAGGYNGFSYADISAAVGIHKASIHHHFPTKAELVSVLVGRYVRQAQEGLRSLRQQVSDPAEQLDAYVGYWQKCVLDDAEPFCVCAMLASEIQLLPDAVAAQVRAHFRNLGEWLATVLETGEEQGSFRLSASPEEEAQMLMASVHGALLSARAFGDAKLFFAIVSPQLAKLRT
ncbi:TetR/AcrR family transcriptional regulator [Flaviflagellibacter deserti]|uniref:TetR/AcrR family transcriptional regulator n=1 Tax=Flaviflagellibacter deserti TaxID=2267266 RepID=A0ABV9Z0P2_9HYPH